MSEAARVRIWVLVGVLFLVHFLLHVGFSLGPEAPDLLTVGLLLAAREVGLGKAAALGLFFGLLDDSLPGSAFGANSVALVTVGILGAFTRDLFVGDSRFFVVSYFFAGKWARDSIHWIMIGEGLRQPFAHQVLVQGAMGAAYAAVIGIGLVALTGLPGES